MIGNLKNLLRTIDYSPMDRNESCVKKEASFSKRGLKPHGRKLSNISASNM
jgi:hypothetical protein